jgi:hypothetical protein
VSLIAIKCRVVLLLRYGVFFYDIKKEMGESRVGGIPTKNFVENGIDKPVPEFDKGIQFTGISGLLQEVGFEFLFPLFFIESEPELKLIEHYINVHQIKMVSQNLRNHTQN